MNKLWKLSLNDIFQIKKVSQYQDKSDKISNCLHHQNLSTNSFRNRQNFTKLRGFDPIKIGTQACCQR